MIEHCKIRTFEQRDLPRLHEIREAAYKPIFKSFRSIVGEKIAAVALANAEREQGEFLDEICQANSAHEVFVVEHVDEIVAFCSITCNRETKVGVVDLNAVHPDCQGEGVGTWMYEYAVKRLSTLGMLVAEVGTGGDPSHAPARKAYAKAGFGPGIPSVYLYQELSTRV
jgi:GNAT superfamily N-acetyltransferase